ncbi:MULTISPECIES: hypothetical protein [unclassified Rathayibacter]|uniref:hypothetical protein n=1 Tax=unclassified Rathayibacter TaxID=2609250 RepID=UPI0006F29DC0|nr:MULTISPECIES: hypothetical protein [unclassified Rathayibacter]KQQ04017.1 hypothetical protein ASF42_11315 [Rathayibacter sp. Leaf294]KQS12471.1 hypothetical protein ASG06_11315 [Rathayibacter sp. Leaf185]
MTSPPPSLPERLQRLRADVSVLAGTSSERTVRPLREAVDAVARGGPADLLDAVEGLTALLARAEGQLSRLERSVRDDLDRAATLSTVRTSAQLASAADVATAGAAASALLLDADEARAAAALHDPAAALTLLLEADAVLDTVVTGYREPRAQAERQLLLFEASRTAARLGADAAALLGRIHGDRVTAAPRILAEETVDRLDSLARLAATDPATALEQAREAVDRGRSALDETLVDLDAVG